MLEKYKTLLVGLCLVALGVTGCSVASSEVAEVDARSFSPVGVSADDVDAGYQGLVDSIDECLRARGFEFQSRPFVSLNTDLLTGLGPISGYLLQLEDPDLFVQGPGQLEGAPVGLAAAYDTCDREVSESWGERLDGVKDDVARLDAQWAAFETSQTYQSALGGFSECTRADGFDFTSPDDANIYLQDRLTTAMGEVPDGGDGDHIAQVRSLLSEEDVVRELVLECWNGHLREPLGAYSARLRDAFSEEIDAARAAYRGDVS